MPSMLRPKSRAARAVAALLSLALAWQLAAPAAYALAEEADEAPAAGEAMEEAPGQEGPEAVDTESADGNLADADTGDGREEESEGLEDVPGPLEQEEEGADSPQEGPAESELSGGLEPRPLSISVSDSDSLAAGVRHAGNWGECSWSIDSAGLLRIWPTDGESGQLADSRGYEFDEWGLVLSEQHFFPWTEYTGDVKTVAVEPGVVLPCDASGMLYGCGRLASLDASGWDTSLVEDMSCMFSDCPSLVSLDVSGWDTSTVWGMSSMFKGCSSLTSLDTTGWDASAVEYMRWMFQDCTSLTSLDLSGWDTSSVTDMGSMFSGCTELASLDLSGWDTSTVWGMSSMFKGCSSLTSLDLSGWKTPSAHNTSGMFSGCSRLSSLDLSGWDTSRVASMKSMFSGCSSLASLDASGWDTSSVTAMGGMFSGCTSLTSLEASGWDTSDVTSMNSMFSGCSSLASLDASGWDTWAATDMTSMFYGCSSLSSLEASDWDTSRVTSMWGMFYGCSSLASLDLSNWDTSRVTSAWGMFIGCGSLSRISVGERYDTSKAFPTAPGGGRWRSVATGKTYEAGEIAYGCRFVADTYTLVGSGLASASIDPIPEQAYTGQALKPAVTVRVGSRKLVAGTDYAVSYRDNVEVGTATVTITGRGRYEGARTATFRVVPASLSKATFAPISKQLRTGEALEPSVAVTLGGRALVAGTDYTVAYANNVELGTATVTVTGKGKYKGTAKATFEIVDSVGTVEVYRLYNWRTSEHLWTTSANEYKQLPIITKGDWRQEGVAWNAPDGYGEPVYRLYNKRMGDHYYSMSKAEIDALTTKHGWTVDNGGKPAFWSAGKDDAGVSPLFCVYNRRLKRGQHHFTADKNERDFLVANAGWRYEKEAFYGYVTKK